MNKIKVSILVSTYNWPEALEFSLRSMFAQTILPDEIVIACLLYTSDAADD